MPIIWGTHWGGGRDNDERDSAAAPRPVQRHLVPQVQDSTMPPPHKRVLLDNGQGKDIMCSLSQYNNNITSQDQLSGREPTVSTQPNLGLTRHSTPGAGRGHGPSTYVTGHYTSPPSLDEVCNDTSTRKVILLPMPRLSCHTTLAI